MKNKRGKIYIGTSGWLYGQWDGIFYPTELSAKEKLKFYSRYFNTVEINSTFYHKPLLKTVLNWYNQTPKNFVFSLKANREFTHFKKLKVLDSEIDNFFKQILALKEKLGPVLFQFPSSFKPTDQLIKNFKEFFLRIYKKKDLKTVKIAVEFREKNWFNNKEILKFLKNNKICLVFAHSSRYPYPNNEPITSDFVYLRFHGPKELFASLYSLKDLKPWIEKVKSWQAKGLDVFVYFNNDFFGYALKNAKMFNDNLKI